MASVCFLDMRQPWQGQGCGELIKVVNSAYNCRDNFFGDDLSTWHCPMGLCFVSLRSTAVYSEKLCGSRANEAFVCTTSNHNA
jgi:hypothetical protein